MFAEVILRVLLRTKPRRAPDHSPSGQVTVVTPESMPKNVPGFSRGFRLRGDLFFSAEHSGTFQTTAITHKIFDGLGFFPYVLAPL